MRKELELAWAAGFFDGEGCINVYEVPGANTGYRYVRLKVKQVDRGSLDRFQAAVGFGKVLGPYRHDHGPHRGNCKPIFQYYCGKRHEVRATLQSLLPYLSEVKADEAREALAHMPIKRRKNRLQVARPASG